MLEKLGYKAALRMLEGAVSEIRANHELLSRLDSVGGDGDHGTTMVRAMSNLEKAAAAGCQDLKTLFHDVGWAILGVDGGAIGPLLGTFFTSMSEAVGAEALDAGELASAFEAGLAGVQAQSKARVGDKTLIDALVPAVQALRKAAVRGDSIGEAFRAAAEAAEQGAMSTKGLQARFGRAKNIKEKSIGSQDPGATSVSLIFKGFQKGIESHA